MERVEAESSPRRKLAEEFAMKVGDRFSDNVLLIMLYGSVARGEDEKGSDIDILIITDRFCRELKESTFEICCGVYYNRNEWISAYCCTKDQFQRYRKDRFFEDIMEKGIVLWGNSNDLADLFGIEIQENEAEGSGKSFPGGTFRPMEL